MTGVAVIKLTRREERFVQFLNVFGGILSFPPTRPQFSVQIEPQDGAGQLTPAYLRSAGHSRGCEISLETLNSSFEINAGHGKALLCQVWGRQATTRKRKGWKIPLFPLWKTF
jgi:hypothetical protein